MGLYPTKKSKEAIKLDVPCLRAANLETIKFITAIAHRTRKKRMSVCKEMAWKERSKVCRGEN